MQHVNGNAVHVGVRVTLPSSSDGHFPVAEVGVGAGGAAYIGFRGPLGLHCLKHLNSVCEACGSKGKPIAD